MKPRHYFLLASALLLVAGEAHATGILDSVQQSMQTASSGWMDRGLSYGKNLFGSLAAIELSWAAAQYTLQKGDVADLLGWFTLKIAAIGFFFTILTFAPTWVPAIVNSFAQMGQSIGGGGPTLTPSGIFNQGMSIAATLIGSLHSPDFSFSAIASYMLDDIIVGVSGLIVVLAFAVVAMQLFMTLVESYIVIGGGAVMLGFLGSRWTATFGEKYFGYAVSVGIKRLYAVLCGNGCHGAAAAANG